MVNKLTNETHPTVIGEGNTANPLSEVAPNNEPVLKAINIAIKQPMKNANKTDIKKLIKRYLPTPQQIQTNKYLKVFGKFIHDPNLWHLNRRCVASAFTIGLFVCYLPMIGHMALAALLAIIFRANLALSIALVWIANPFTMPPMYYFGYKVGAWILHAPLKPFHFEMSWHWLVHEVGVILLPLFLGCAICGAILGVLGNIWIRLYWRYNVSRAWKARAAHRQQH